jgi:hypothetical protein
MYLKWGTVGEGEKGTGRKGKGEGGGQCTANQGSEWTGIRATSQRRDFQVSKRGVQGIRVGVSKQLSKGLGHALPYIMLIVYISRYKDCV